LLLWALGALVLLRLLSLGIYPLTDATEARYADIARRMVERNDWVTPWFSDTAPFWAKPPLSFWASAFGFELLGLNEFAARLPHLLLGSLVAILVWVQGRQMSQRAAWHGVALLAGAALFLVASGAVMTDMAMTLGTTLVMVGFWRALHDDTGSRSGAWLMVLGASIGLLAKGPVSLILCGVPIVVWVSLTGRLVSAWRRIPWLRIGAIVLVLSLPWYVVAEARTPGFLRYFIVGEHWHRFFTAGWAGDLYGSAHQFPRGTIWLFALGAALPWTLLAPFAWLVGREPALTSAATRRDGEAAYLWAWALTPCVFFTFAGNILWTYVLPGLPALAILGGCWTATRRRRVQVEGLITLGVIACCAALIGLLTLPKVSNLLDARSAKSLVDDYRADAAPEQPLYFLGGVPFSGSFYTQGKARAIADLRDLPVGQPAYVILNKDAFNALASDVRMRLQPRTIRGNRVLARIQ